MSGYSRTDSRCSDTRPKMISNRLITVAKTGRLTDNSDICTRPTPERSLAKAPSAPRPKIFFHRTYSDLGDLAPWREIFFLPLTRRRRSRGGLANARCVAHFQRTLDDHALPLLQAARNLHFTRLASTDGDLALERHAVLDHEREHAPLLRYDRGLGDQQCGGRRAVHAYGHERAR